MAKTKTIVGGSARERFSDVVKSGIEKIAGEMGVPLGVAMGMTKAYFLAKGKAQGEVTVEDFNFAVTEIKAQKLTAAKNESGGRIDIRDRMSDPNDVENWDLGRWKGKFPIWLLLEKYPTGDLTGEMLDGLATELAARKVADAAVVGERPDPDSLVAEVKMPCAAKRHSGANPLEFAGMRNKVERVDGLLTVRNYPGSQEPIVAGDFLKLDGFEGPIPLGVIKVEEAGTVLFGRRYCLDCQAAAKEEFRARRELPATDPNHVEGVLTFYTVAGLRTLAQREGSGSQARDEEGGSTSRKPIFGIGSRKASGWHNWRTAGGRQHGR